MNKAALKHLKTFMQQMQLYPASGRGVVAVSGGLDSMFLLACLAQLRNSGEIKKLEVIHINHGSRADCIEDERLVLKFCEKLHLKLKIKRIKLLADTPNFEHEARLKRQEIFQGELEIGDLLYTGHHIDDSYEWSLMQTFRSSAPERCLGIPVIHNQIARPLMAFTRDQIARLAKNQALPFREDLTNQNCRYDRNYLRHEVLPLIQKRWPGSKKLYVSRAKELASKYRLDREIQLLEKDSGVNLFQLENGVRGLFDSELKMRSNFNEDLLRYAIENQSKQGRGVLYGQIKKLKQALNNQSTGPLLFSGQVEAYPLPGGLVVKSKEKKLDWHLGTQIPVANLSRVIQILKGPSFCPFLLAHHPGLSFKGIQVGKTHPLGRQVLEEFEESINSGILCHSVKILNAWRKGQIKTPTLALTPVYLGKA